MDAYEKLIEFASKRPECEQPAAWETNLPHVRVCVRIRKSVHPHARNVYRATKDELTLPNNGYVQKRKGPLRIRPFYNG